MFPAQCLALCAASGRCPATTSTSLPLHRLPAHVTRERPLTRECRPGEGRAHASDCGAHMVVYVTSNPCRQVRAVVWFAPLRPACLRLWCSHGCLCYFKSLPSGSQDICWDACTCAGTHARPCYIRNARCTCTPRDLPRKARARALQGRK